MEEIFGNVLVAILVICVKKLLWTAYQYLNAQQYILEALTPIRKFGNKEPQSGENFYMEVMQFVTVFPGTLSCYTAFR